MAFRGPPKRSDFFSPFLNGKWGPFRNLRSCSAAVSRVQDRHRLPAGRKAERGYANGQSGGPLPSPSMPSAEATEHRGGAAGKTAAPLLRISGSRSIVRLHKSVARLQTAHSAARTAAPGRISPSRSRPTSAAARRLSGISAACIESAGPRLVPRLPASIRAERSAAPCRALTRPNIPEQTGPSGGFPNSSRPAAAGTAERRFFQEIAGPLSFSGCFDTVSILLPV